VETENRSRTKTVRRLHVDLWIMPILWGCISAHLAVDDVAYVLPSPAVAIVTIDLGVNGDRLGYAVKLRSPVSCWIRSFSSLILVHLSLASFRHKRADFSG